MMNAGNQEGRHSEPDMGHGPRRMPSELDPNEARSNWIGWIKWYMATHQAEVPTQAELARRLKVQKGAIQPLLDERGTTCASFRTLVHSANLTGANLDLMLRSKPPMINAGSVTPTAAANSSRRKKH